MNGKGQLRRGAYLWRPLAAGCVTAAALVAHAVLANVDLSSDWGKLSASYLLVFALASWGLGLAIGAWKGSRRGGLALPDAALAQAASILCLAVSLLLMGWTFVRTLSLAGDVFL